MLLADSEAYLQAALDAVTQWGHQWRFSFGIGPEKSAVMVFGPARSRPSCAVSLSGHLLEVVPSYRCLGVVLTPSLRWDAHVAHILARGLRLFAHSTSWARSEGLLASFSHFIIIIIILMLIIIVRKIIIMFAIFFHFSFFDFFVFFIFAC